MDMTSLAMPQFKKVQNVSRLISALALFAAAFITLIVIGFAALILCELLSPHATALQQLATDYFAIVQIDYAHLSIATRLQVVGSLMVFTLFSALFCYYLHRLFKAFRHNGVFSSCATQAARRLAWIFSLSFALGLLLEWLMPIPTQSQALQGLSTSTTFQDLILVASLWICVWVLEYGQALQIESDMTI